MEVGQIVLFKELQFKAKITAVVGHKFTFMAVDWMSYGKYDTNAKSLRFDGEEEIRPVTFELLADEQAT